MICVGNHDDFTTLFGYMKKQGNPLKNYDYKSKEQTTRQITINHLNNSDDNISCLALCSCQ